MSPAEKLLRWYKTNGRDLPWRKTRDPYKILVSEIMLQQTQVPRVLLFYKKWLTLFPTWKTLAKATNADVIRAWAVLGYNRRALILRDIAKKVTQNGIPKTLKEWQTLKGIGPYTASALMAFSQKARVLPIDTNIRRVLDRFFLGLPYPDQQKDAELLKKSETFLPNRGAYYDIPQALFDLATDICIKTPLCTICPLRKECKAATLFLAGTVIAPKAMLKKAKESRHRNKPYPDRIYRGRILKLIREKNGMAKKEIGPYVDPDFQKDLDLLWLNA